MALVFSLFFVAVLRKQRRKDIKTQRHQDTNRSVHICIYVRYVWCRAKGQEGTAPRASLKQGVTRQKNVGL